MRVSLWLLLILQLGASPQTVVVSATRQSLRGDSGLANEDDESSVGGTAAERREASETNIDGEEAIADEVQDDIEDELHRGSNGISPVGGSSNSTIDQYHRTDLAAPKQHLFQTRIIGGRNVVDEQDTFAVSLHDRHGNHFCGATLITKDCVLTAAHCTDKVTSKGPITAVLDRRDLGHEEVGERLRIRFEKLHPRYNVDKANQEWKYDFAIMCFTRPTMTRAKVIPLNSDKNMPRSGSQVVVYGWGDTNPHPNIREPSEHLQMARLRMMSNKQCGAINGMYGTYSVSYAGYIEDDMMCAKNRRRDTCQGDSGGPLVYQGKLVGVTSWGVGCKSRAFPGVYARVSHAYGWIKRQVCSRSMYPYRSFGCEPWRRRDLGEEEEDEEWEDEEDEWEEEGDAD